MRIQRCGLPLVYLLGVWSAGFGAASGAAPGSAAAPVGRAFVADLATPDKLIVATGRQDANRLWRNHALTARTSLVVVTDGLEPSWVETLLEVKRRRPEVTVVVMADRDVLARGDLGPRLARSGARVLFRTPLAANAHFPVLDSLRGNLVVRDGESVLLASGVTPSDPQETFLNVWLLESLPVAESYQRMLSVLQAELPGYPEASVLFDLGSKERATP